MSQARERERERKRESVPKKSTAANARRLTLEAQGGGGRGRGKAAETAPAACTKLAQEEDGEGCDMTSSEAIVVPTGDMMSSEPIVGYKRSAPDAPDTSDDDGSQPERGKEAEAPGPHLDQAERQRNKKLRRAGEARNLSREERKMTVIMRQVEEMEQKEKAVQSGPCFTQREGRVGHAKETVGEKRGLRDACLPGGEGTAKKKRKRKRCFSKAPKARPKDDCKDAFNGSKGGQSIRNRKGDQGKKVLEIQDVCGRHGVAEVVVYAYIYLGYMTCSSL
jgi:hypothetical protein